MVFSEFLKALKGLGQLGGEQPPSDNNSLPKELQFDLKQHLSRLSEQSSDFANLMTIFDGKYTEFNAQDFSHIEFGERQKACEMAAAAAYVVSQIAVQNCVDNLSIKATKDFGLLCVFALVASQYFSLISGGDAEESTKIGEGVTTYVFLVDFPERLNCKSTSDIYGEGRDFIDIQELGKGVYNLWASRQHEASWVIDLFVSKISSFCAEFDERNLFIVRKYIEYDRSLVG